MNQFQVKRFEQQLIRQQNLKSQSEKPPTETSSGNSGAESSFGKIDTIFVPAFLLHITEFAFALQSGKTGLEWPISLHMSRSNFWTKRVGLYVYETILSFDKFAPWGRFFQSWFAILTFAKLLDVKFCLNTEPLLVWILNKSGFQLSRFGTPTI